MPFAASPCFEDRASVFEIGACAGRGRRCGGGERRIVAARPVDILRREIVGERLHDAAFARPVRIGAQARSGPRRAGHAGPGRARCAVHGRPRHDSARRRPPPRRRPPLRSRARSRWSRRSPARARGRSRRPSDTPQERDDRPDLVVAPLRHPGRHAGVFDAVLDDPEQLLVIPSRMSSERSGGARQHAPRHRIARHARRAMTRRAVAVKKTDWRREFQDRDCRAAVAPVRRAHEFRPSCA